MKHSREYIDFRNLLLLERRVILQLGNLPNSFKVYISKVMYDLIKLNMWLGFHIEVDARLKDQEYRIEAV